MDWLNRMNKALAYVEDNLAEEIDYGAAAELVRCSTYHFQKIFILMAGVPLSEYIRRRRLSQAAFELQNSDIKVLDLALKYGYSSPTAFNRAFQAMHLIPPNEARKPGVRIMAYPPISFQISIKGAVEMNYRIEKKEAFRVVGLKTRTTMENEACFRAIPELWQEFHKTGGPMRLLPLMNGEPMGVMGLSNSCDRFNTSEFDYYIAVASDMEPPEDMEAYTVPAAAWAVFECIGPMPDAIQELEKRIVTEWLPTSGYEYGIGPDIELYPDERAGNLPDYRSEVWMPVVKKG